MKGRHLLRAVAETAILIAVLLASIASSEDEPVEPPEPALQANPPAALPPAPEPPEDLTGIIKTLGKTKREVKALLGPPVSKEKPGRACRVMCPDGKIADTWYRCASQEFEHTINGHSVSVFLRDNKVDAIMYRLDHWSGPELNQTTALRALGVEERFRSARIPDPQFRRWAACDLNAIVKIDDTPYDLEMYFPGKGAFLMIKDNFTAPPANKIVSFEKALKLNAN